MLPYRDEAGRISLTLLRVAAAKVETGELEVLPEVRTTLTKWRRHAEKQVAKGGHDWSLTAEGAWLGPGGELREVVAGTGGDTEDEEGSDEEGGEGADVEPAKEAEEAQLASDGVGTKRKAAGPVDDEGSHADQTLTPT